MIISQAEGLVHLSSLLVRLLLVLHLLHDMGYELLELVHLGLCLGEYKTLLVLELLILICQLVNLLCLAF